MVKDGCGRCGLKAQKFAVSQEGINGINKFLVC